MARSSRNHAPEFEAGVALRAIRGDQTLPDLAWHESDGAMKRRGSMGAAPGAVSRPYRGATLIAGEILSKQPGPPLWS